MGLALSIMETTKGLPQTLMMINPTDHHIEINAVEVLSMSIKLQADQVTFAFKIQ